MNNLERYKKDFTALCELGKALQMGFISEHTYYPEFKKFFNSLSDEKKEYAKKHSFSEHYQGWYNESLRLIKQLMPERL